MTLPRKIGHVNVSEKCASSVFRVEVFGMMGWGALLYFVPLAKSLRRSILVTITVNILVNILVNVLVTIWPKQSPHFCLVFRMSGVHFSARTPDTVAGFRNLSLRYTSLAFRYFLYPTPYSLSYHCRYVTEVSAVFCVHCSCLNLFSLFRQNACTDSTTSTLCLSYLQAS